MPGHSWSARAFRHGNAPVRTLGAAVLARKRSRFVVVVALASFLAGCATFSADGGMSTVNRVVAQEVGHDAEKIGTEDAAARAADRTLHLLKAALSIETAVQVALLNNKGLQAAYNDLGIAEAEMVKASRPPNPTFSLSRISTPVELDIERSIVADILALATLPARAEIAAERFREAQLRAALATLRVAAETRRSYYQAVAAAQAVVSLAQAASAADTAAKLAAELSESGAMNKIDREREDAFHAEVAIQLAAARQRAAREGERLTRAMGLVAGGRGFTLPQALPALPRRMQTLLAVETEALRRRVDLQIARIELAAAARSYGLTNASRFINLLEVSGVSRTQSENGLSGTGGGIEMDFQIPIFDFGEARVREVGETYMKAVNRLTEKAVDVRSEAREAYQAYRSSYDIANRYRSEVLPLRRAISDEMMLRYGAMQVDVFSLLTDAQRRIGANITAIEAQKDFWLASVDLDAALTSGAAADRDFTSRMVASPADKAARE
jgi:outer membrane protein TolC